MAQDFQQIDLKFAINEIEKVSDKENEICNTFVEMLKDEIDSNDEPEIYYGVKKLILKYIDNEQALGLIDEVIESITDGASMTEILLVARDEVMEPTPSNVMNYETITGHDIDGPEMNESRH